MKRILSFVLTLLMLFSQACSVCALESGVSSFSITAVEPNQKNRYIYVNITAPATREDSTLLMGFFKDGTLTGLTPFDISTEKEFKNQKINIAPLVTDENGKYYLDQTPDEIKIFTWNKSSLAPKTLCDNVLTPEVISAANHDVVESLKIVPEATNSIRNNHLTWEEDYLDGAADSWDDHLFPIMDYIDNCAIKAIEDAGTHLLTSPYAQKQYEDELSKIRSLIAAAPSEQKNKLVGLLSSAALGNKYYDALENAQKFLDFSLR